MKDDPAEFEPRRRGRCDQCGDKIANRRPKQRFCHPTCRQAYWRDAKVRGSMLYEDLYRWRIHRGKRGTEGEGKISSVAAKIDRWIAADTQRMRGDPTPADPVAKATATATPTKR